MTQDRPLSIADVNERTRQAIQEVKRAIVAQFPATTFELAHAADDPHSIHLIAVADVEDPDEVGDLVIDRIVALQVEEGIPLHVIPLRTPERAQAALEVDQSGIAWRSARSVRLLGEIA